MLRNCLTQRRTALSITSFFHPDFRKPTVPHALAANTDTAFSCFP